MKLKFIDFINENVKNIKNYDINNLSVDELREIALWGLEGYYSDSGCWDDTDGDVEKAIDHALEDFNMFLGKDYPLELGNIPNKPIVYRIIRLRDKSNFNNKNMGNSWFSNPLQYENSCFYDMLEYLVKDKNDEGETYLVKGEISINNINVASTLWERSTQWCENEIVVKDDNVVKVLSLEKMSDVKNENRIKKYGKK